MRLMPFKKETRLFTCFALAVTGMLLIQGCYYHKPDITLPVSTCDTTNIKFSVNIVPILRTNCYSCHTTGQSSGNTELDTYAGVKSAVTLGHIPDVFYRTGMARMPQNQDPLSSCEVAMIRTWIRNGALNN